MATKYDVKNLRQEISENFVTKTEFQAFRGEFFTHLDGITKRFVDFEQELVFLHARTDRHNDLLGLA